MLSKSKSTLQIPLIQTPICCGIAPFLLIQLTIFLLLGLIQWTLAPSHHCPTFIGFAGRNPSGFYYIFKIFFYGKTFLNKTSCSKIQIVLCSSKDLRHKNISPKNNLRFTVFQLVFYFFCLQCKILSHVLQYLFVDHLCQG